MLFTTASIAQIKKTVLISRNYNPVVIVDTFQTTFRTLILDPGQIKATKKVKVHTGPSNCLLHDVVIIELKKDDIEMVRIDKIFDFFQVTAENRKLQISINNILINNPATILANIKDIKKVEVTDYLYSEDFLPQDKDVKYLNISI